MMVVCSDRKIAFKVIVLTFSLDESRDDDTKHQAKDRVGQVGVVQEAGGQVWAEQLERRLEDDDGAKEEIKAAHNEKDEARYFDFCIHLHLLSRTGD